MKKSILSILFLSVIYFVYSQNDFKVIGYVGQNNIYSLSDFELSKITHLDIAFINPLENGTLVFAPYAGNGTFGSSDITISDAVRIAHKYNVKAIASLAGGGFWGDSYMRNRYRKLLDSTHRTAFIVKLIKYLEKNKLDGIDIDIEGDAVCPDLGPFMAQLADSCHQRGWEVSAAWSGNSMWSDSVPSLALESVDYINIMSYDHTGAWAPENPGQHASYEDAVKDIEYWIKRGVPAEKLTLGVPFYGKRFSGAVTSVEYKDAILSNSKNADRDQDNKLWYNGRPTIKKKVELAIEKKLGGVMIWELLQDSKGKYSLLSEMNETIINHQLYPKSTNIISYRDGITTINDNENNLTAIQQVSIFDNSGTLIKTFSKNKLKVKGGIIALKAKLAQEDYHLLTKTTTSIYLNTIIASE